VLTLNDLISRVRTSYHIFLSTLYAVYNTVANESDEVIDEAEVRVMPLERFVMDLLKRGYEPQWCDAAFRAFSSSGLMNKYEYAIAGISSHSD